MRRIDIVQDDEDRCLFVYDGRIDLRNYDIPEEEREKWLTKLRENRYTVTFVKDGSETVH